MHKNSSACAQKSPCPTNSTRKNSKSTVIDRATSGVLAQQPRKIISTLSSTLVPGTIFTTRLPKGHPDSTVPQVSKRQMGLNSFLKNHVHVSCHCLYFFSFKIIVVGTGVMAPQLRARTAFPQDQSLPQAAHNCQKLQSQGEPLPLASLDNHSHVHRLTQNRSFKKK